MDQRNNYSLHVEYMAPDWYHEPPYEENAYNCPIHPTSFVNGILKSPGMAVDRICLQFHRDNVDAKMVIDALPEPAEQESVCEYIIHGYHADPAVLEAFLAFDLKQFWCVPFMTLWAYDGPNLVLEVEDHYSLIWVYRPIEISFDDLGMPIDEIPNVDVSWSKAEREARRMSKEPFVFEPDKHQESLPTALEELFFSVELLSALADVLGQMFDHLEAEALEDPPSSPEDESDDGR